MGHLLVGQLSNTCCTFYCCTHLLSRITDIDVQDYDECTALHYAARNHHNTVAVRLLEDKGADMTLPDGIGDTSVHMAAESGNHEYVSHIIYYANIDLEVANAVALCVHTVCMNSTYLKVIILYRYICLQF